MSLDYDLFVLDPENGDTTVDQARDCLFDALTRIDERLTELERRR